jgi:hypothetical protein
MKRILVAGLAVTVVLGLAAGAHAQLYPPFPGSYQSLYDLYPTPPSPLDVGPRGIMAGPSCGAANPQGGIPTSVTWGSCP